MTMTKSIFMGALASALLSSTAIAGSSPQELPILLAQATNTEEAVKPKETAADAPKPAETGAEEVKSKAAKPLAKAKKKKVGGKAAEEASKADEEAAKPEKEAPAKADVKAEEPVVAKEKVAHEPDSVTAPAAETKVKKEIKQEAAKEDASPPSAEPAKETAPKSAEQPALKEAEKVVKEPRPAKKKKIKKVADEAVETAPRKAAKREKAPTTKTTPADDAASPDSNRAPAAEAAAIVKDDLSKAEKENLAQAEKKRRKKKRERRNELIGAAAAGVVVGVIVNELGGRVVSDEGDRIIVERDGEVFVRKDDNERLRNNGARVTEERLSGGRMRTIAERPNGVRVITVRDSGGFILRRVKEMPNGDRFVLIDNSDIQPTQPTRFRDTLAPVRVGIPLDEYVVNTSRADRRSIRQALNASPVEATERAYTLREIRESERLRSKVRRVDLNTITFDSGSYVLTRSQVEQLADIADVINKAVDDNTREVFLIEGHTDAVGDNLSNLTLSDRRAETIARVMTEVFRVPPENMVVQGYGEQYLKVATEAAERENRRVSVRRITPLLSGS